MRLRWLVFTLLILIALEGCAPVNKGVQGLVGEKNLPLSGEHSIGQTFTAIHAGLQGIELYLAPQIPGSGSLQLCLTQGPGYSNCLMNSQRSLADITQPGWYGFTFSPLRNSYLNDYYLRLSIEGAGSVAVGNAPGNTYLDGSAYQDGLPIDDTQLSFKLLFSLPFMVGGLLRQGLIWLGWTAVALLVYILPGWALLSGLWGGWEKLTWVEKLGLAGATSLAAYPLLMLWTNLIGLHLGAYYAWLPAAIAIVFLIWKNLSRGTFRRTRLPSINNPGLFPDITFIFIALLIIGVRLYVIRLVPIPMWGDSVQHTVMAQLFMDHGGLFNSWAPYAPYTSMTVQYGFPASSTLFAWVSGLAIPQATQVNAQLINALAIFALFPLATRLSAGNRWAGIVAILVAGLLSPLPAGYVNWGRFAQLAGQAVLPVAIWLTWDILAADRISKRKVFLAALVITGMLLNYYRMFFYFGTFLLVLVLFWYLPAHWKQYQSWVKHGLALMAIIIVTILLVLPWLVHVSGSTLAAAVGSAVSTETQLEVLRAEYLTWKSIQIFVPYPLLAIAAIAWLISLVRRQWLVSILLVWVVLLAAVPASILLHLPGANLMQSFAILIALYIPLGLLIGSGAGWLVEELVDRYRVAGKTTAIILIVGIALLGAYWQRGIIQPMTYSMVTRPDLRAMNWIKESTPPEARFLVEGFRISSGLSIVGSDAGWWIPLFTGRANTMPPQYAILNEKPDPTDLNQRLVNLVNLLENFSPASTEGFDGLCREGITHVYIGQGQGLVGLPARQLFTPEMFMNSPGFNMVYAQDRVRIFAVQTRLCPTR